MRASMGGSNSNVVSGWILRPFLSPFFTPQVELTFLSHVTFPQIMGNGFQEAWEQRCYGMMQNLRGKMKAIMGMHPIVQMQLNNQMTMQMRAQQRKGGGDAIGVVNSDIGSNSGGRNAS